MVCDCLQRAVGGVSKGDAEEDAAAPGSEGAAGVMLNSVYLLLQLLWLETSPRKRLLLEKRDSKVVLELGVLRVLSGRAALQARGDPTYWEQADVPRSWLSGGSLP